MGQRRDRLDGRLAAAKVIRQKNSVRKTDERNRRDKLMLEMVKEHQFPYTPAVMSWVSAKLGKKTAQIKPDDVKALLK